MMPEFIELAQCAPDQTLMSGGSATTQAAALFAGLLIVRVLLELAQEAALLHLHVEAF